MNARDRLPHNPITLLVNPRCKYRIPLQNQAAMPRMQLGLSRQQLCGTDMRLHETNCEKSFVKKFEFFGIETFLI